MKVLKKIAMVAATTFAATLLVGCGQKTNPKEITFWNPLTGDDGAYMNNIVKEYNKTNPEYPVKAVVTSDMYTKIYTAMNSKKGIPDLALIHADRVPAFVDSDMLKPMTSILEQQKNIKSDNYLPQAWDAGQIDGTQYTVPLDIHANAMYYNKDLLKKYGCESFLDDNVVTFDEMMSLAGKLDKGDYVLNNSLISWVILGEIVNQGGDIEKDGKPNLNTTEMRNAFEAIKDLASAGLMTPNGEDGYLMFQSGNVLFSTDGTWTSTAHDAVDGLNYGVTNIYSFSPDKFTNRASSHMFALLKSDERTKGKEKGIGEFLEYVRKNSIEWAKAGQIVASKEVVESDDFKDYKQSFFTSTPEEVESLHIFTYKYYSYVEEAINTYAMDIIYGDKSIDEGLKDIQKFAEDKIAENENGTEE
ncbi:MULTISPECIES: extracellular solute-binding protein [Streptococcus]|uniref:extracellular solute-binding protein n=1 Tax=Streptococcus TaxID=1301 RepID=UPI0022837973|nr:MULTISPECIES: extracellular solute-binding protein [Streptococcus]MCR5052213.1 extracellular solute-binding protein [Streptococcus sp.]MCY7188522.1 extracellular solute-binding protein [Streptococcus gallolyticus subsp. gallolyticus]